MNTANLRRGLCLALAAHTPAVSLAQVFPEVLPHYTLWDNNHGRGDQTDPCIHCRNLGNNGGPIAPPNGWTPDSRFHGMIIQRVDTGSAEFHPTKVARQIACRMKNFTGQIEKGKVHLLLHGMAHCDTSAIAAGEQQATCLLHPDDAIPWSAEWFPNTDALGTRLIRAANPWMTNAAAAMNAWAIEFATEYRRIALTGILDPAQPATGCNVLAQVATMNMGGGQTVPLYAFPIDRLLLDSETYPVIFDDRVVKAMANSANDPGDPDDRWNTRAVPGFGGRTMAQLWAEAQAQWDTTNSTYQWHPSIATVIGTANLPYFRAVKRRPYLWLNTITLQAKQAVIETAVLEPMRNILADLGTVPRTGNYGEFGADGAADDFGWQRVRGPDADRNEDPVGSGPIPQPPMVESRVRPRVSISRTNESSRMIGYDALGWWQSFKTRPRGAYTVGQPQLYPVDTQDTNYNHAMRMKSLYVPSHPDENQTDAMHRVNRHRLESAINSNSGSNEYMTEPYVGAPSTIQGGFHYSRSLVRDQLALARAKQLRQANLFHGNPAAAPVLGVWTEAKRVADQVYAFKINNWMWTAGTNPVYSYHPLGDVTNTLRAPASHPLGIDTVLAATSEFDEWLSTEAIAEFEEWLPALGDELRVLYEGRIDIPGEQDIAQPRTFPAYGEILLWDWNESSQSGGLWRAIKFGDDPANTTRYLFGTRDLSTRRGANVAEAHRYVSSTGKVRVMLRHSVYNYAAPMGEFISKHDLLQVMRADSADPVGIVGEGPSGDAEAMSAFVIGPDINHDLAVDSDDLSRFIGAYAADAPAADYNGDGTVTVADAEAFLADYAGAD